MSSKRANTRAIRARNAKVVRDGNGICHLCGHAGADAADHIVPIARGGSDTIDNLAPAHHFTECETCGVKCNRVKSDKLIAPVMPLTPGIIHPGRGDI